MPKSNLTTSKNPHPEDLNQLLTEFNEKRGRGLQKTFIRKLWAFQEDLIANANPSALRFMYFSPALTVCPEGVKLLAEILIKIGISHGLTLLEKLILKFELTDTECQRYGDVFTVAWQKAYQDANFDLTEELETNVISIVCQHALYAHKPVCSKFQKVLLALARVKKEDKNVDEMMTRLLNGCLYRALDANNYIVQSSAAEVFFMFFPLVADDSIDIDKNMENQLRYMLDLLRSDVISIRTGATKNVLKAICDYWLLVPKHIVKEIVSYIIDTVAKDTVVGVRVAVFEGLREMAFVPACMTFFEQAVKVAVAPAIQDKSEKVRLVVYQLIACLKNHKFISVFDVISRDDTIAKLDIENVETCRRQLIPIMHVLLPISETLDEKYYRPRVNLMLGKSRLALLTYFRLLGPMKIINASQASKLIEMFLIWAYRYLRKKEGPLLAENSDAFQKARAYLECALILYMSCKGILMSEGDGSIKGKADILFGKVVKEIFDNYANTPILGTATAISSVIPIANLKSIANDVLSRLADDDVPSEAVEPFLESAIHFNPDAVFDSFENGLSILVDLFGEQHRKNKKKKRDFGNPDEALITTLNRIKYMLQSHSTSNLIAMRDIYRTRALDLLKKLDLIREAIEIRLSEEEKEEFSLHDTTILSALELQFILPLFVATNGCQDDNDRKTTIGSMKQLLLWFEQVIVTKIKTVGDHNQDFAVQLTCTFLDCANVALTAYDFKTRPVEFEDEDCDENRELKDEEKKIEDETTVAEIISRILSSFCNSATPHEIFTAALRIGATLCEESYSEVHGSMVTLLRFIPKWMNKLCEIIEEDEDNPLECKEIVEALRQFYKKVTDTDSWGDDSAQRMIHHFTVFSIVAVSKYNDNAEYLDPRSEDYKPPHFISLALIKFILKDKTLTDDLIEEFSKNYMPEDSKYFTDVNEDMTTNKKLTKLALLSHFLRILERYSKFHTNLIKDSIDSCTTRVLDCFANATDLETVENHIMNSLSSLLDVELPVGF